MSRKNNKQKKAKYTRFLLQREQKQVNKQEQIQSRKAAKNDAQECEEMERESDYEDIEEEDQQGVSVNRRGCIDKKKYIRKNTLEKILKKTIRKVKRHNVFVRNKSRMEQE